MSAAKVFFDTNIFVYAKLTSEADHQKHEEALRLINEQEDDIVVSIQVINELSNVLLRYKLDDETIWEAIREISQDCLVFPITLATVEKAWELRKKYYLSYWDSLIVSSAVENECSKLFTEDLQHGQIIEGSLTVHNPF